MNISIYFIGNILIKMYTTTAIPLICIIYIQIVLVKSFNYITTYPTGSLTYITSSAYSPSFGRLFMESLNKNVIYQQLLSSGGGGNNLALFSSDYTKNTFPVNLSYNIVGPEERKFGIIPMNFIYVNELTKAFTFIISNSFQLTLKEFIFDLSSTSFLTGTDINFGIMTIEYSQTTSMIALDSKFISPATLVLYCWEIKE
jgi:hypothetical protein